MTMPRPRPLLVIAVAGLALAGCASATVTTLAGVPSASVEVPLSVVGCTSADTCVALGTSNSASGPSALGEQRRASGTWHALSVPSAPSSRLAAMACSHTLCLAGGDQPSGDLLWRYDALTSTISVARSPAGGQGVVAMSCASDARCALVDVTSVVGPARLSFTSDAGATWTAPTTIPGTQDVTVTGLVCASETTCLVTASTGTHALATSTTDAGATWTALAVPSSWRTLSDLACWSSSCVALAQGQTSALVRSRDFAATWKSLALTSGTHALACTRATRCIAVGQSSSGAGAITTVVERHAQRVALDYAPTPLFDAACGAHVCAAIGASTLVATTP
jgi:hypothetical protein